MDKLTKGTWIVNTVKHLAELKQYTTELAFYEATEQAGAYNWECHPLFYKCEENKLEGSKTIYIATQSDKLYIGNAFRY
ncbi:hypothetical protein [Paenibacillus lautus]|uniref:hypothetical protein n=1 Tax=Paenibacillus lautus TaxID=1401 RepID=UPI003D2E5A35